MSVTVIAPAGSTLPPLPGHVQVVRYSHAVDVLAALRGCERAVLLSDALGADVLAAVAAAVHECGAAVIEVHSRRWDGETHSPLTAACRGVIAGFGPEAVAQAIRVLEAAD